MSRYETESLVPAGTSLLRLRCKRVSHLTCSVLEPAAYTKRSTQVDPCSDGRKTYTHCPSEYAWNDWLRDWRIRAEATRSASSVSRFMPAGRTWVGNSSARGVVQAASSFARWNVPDRLPRSSTLYRIGRLGSVEPANTMTVPWWRTAVV